MPLPATIRFALSNEDEPCLIAQYLRENVARELGLERSNVALSFDRENEAITAFLLDEAQFLYAIYAMEVGSDDDAYTFATDDRPITELDRLRAIAAGHATALFETMATTDIPDDDLDRENVEDELSLLEADARDYDRLASANSLDAFRATFDGLDTNLRETIFSDCPPSFRALLA